MHTFSDSSDDESDMGGRRQSSFANKRSVPEPPEVVYARKERMHELLSTVQGVSPFFCGLTYREASSLVELEYLEVLTVANNEPVIEAGTTPTWFGVLCQGSLVYLKELSKQVRVEVCYSPLMNQRSN